MAAKSESRAELNLNLKPGCSTSTRGSLPVPRQLILRLTLAGILMRRVFAASARIAQTTGHAWRCDVGAHQRRVGCFPAGS